MFATTAHRVDPPLVTPGAAPLYPPPTPGVPAGARQAGEQQQGRLPACVGPGRAALQPGGDRVQGGGMVPGCQRRHHAPGGRWVIWGLVQGVTNQGGGLVTYMCVVFFCWVSAAEFGQWDAACSLPAVATPRQPGRRTADSYALACHRRRWRGDRCTGLRHLTPSQRHKRCKHQRRAARGAEPNRGPAAQRTGACCPAAL